MNWIWKRVPLENFAAAFSRIGNPLLSWSKGMIYWWKNLSCSFLFLVYEQILCLCLSKWKLPCTFISMVCICVTESCIRVEIPLKCLFLFINSLLKKKRVKFSIKLDYNFFAKLLGMCFSSFFLNLKKSFSKPC